MRSLTKTAISVGSFLYFLLSPLVIKDGSIPKVNNFIAESSVAHFSRAVSVDLGNPADQNVLHDYCVRNGISFSSYNSFNFNITKSRDNEDIFNFSLNNSSYLEEVLGDAEIVHLSGHHEVGREYIFAGVLEDSIYSVNSAVSFKNLGVHDKTKIVFLMTCFGVNALNPFTHELIDKFPNAIFLGYRLRSSGLTGNRKMMEEYLESIDGINTIEDLARCWIDVGNEVYREVPRRDFRALWKEGNLIYELNRFSPKLESWDLRGFIQK